VNAASICATSLSPSPPRESAPGKRRAPDFQMPAKYAAHVTNASLGAVTNADLKL
jgi:hypothetical protein